MERAMAIHTLKQREAELRELGIVGLSLFGSTARADAQDGSDVDLAVLLDPERRFGLFRFNGIANRLQDLLGQDVDLIREPTSKAWMQTAIDRDRIRVF